jgi:hypothetical protein
VNLSCCKRSFAGRVRRQPPPGRNAGALFKTALSSFSKAEYSAFSFSDALNELRFSLKLLLMERKLKRDAGMIKARIWSGALALVALVSLPLQAAEPVKVGSKIDTEGALLGNIILQVLESHGVKTVNKIQLGTTPVVRGAITAGELDIYPEYTGNGAFFFKDENDPAWKNAQQGYEKVKTLDAQKNKLIWLTPAPANNTWTIAVRQDLAEKII